MSLTKKPEMTPKKIAANRANARLSRGPATPEGLERIRGSKATHGFYSRAEGEAVRAFLRALREDPDGFKAALKNVMNNWQPGSSDRK